ncbi:MAG: FtsX-like permease family protein [Spirochaetia bacterium]|jgi:putative ABC transport system permease protein|nr:FtsX-like permease family protein [Spirochaetia bacterium]
MNGLIFKIAYRNLKEHKTKTLIIGTLMALAIMILVVGNSFMETAASGIEKTYIQNFTGDVVITSSEMENASLFMDGSMNNRDELIPVIPSSVEIQDYLNSLNTITAINPQIGGAALLKHKEDGTGFAMLFGVDPEMYEETFQNNINITYGTFLNPGEEGIVLSEAAVRMIKDTSGEIVKPGDSVLLTGMNSVTGTKIREVTVRGTFEFVNESPQLEMISFIDLNNIRIINGMLAYTEVAANLSDSEQSLLGELDEDSLFGSDDAGLFGGDLFSEDIVVLADDLESDYFDILGDTSERDKYSQTDPDAWHYMVVKLDDSVNEKRFIKNLNNWFLENSIDAKASGWLAGAGTIAKMSNTLSIVFNFLVLIVAIVAVIIIMNTLVISVNERIGEIGTMRAIGAEKSFVRSMITLETLMISVIFGIIGAVLGMIITALIGSIGYEAPNTFLQVILGGPVLYPVISVQAVVISLVTVALVGVVASLYPVSIALKISPVKAMGEN